MPATPDTTTPDGDSKAAAPAATARPIGCVGASLGMTIAALVLAAAAGGYFVARVNTPMTTSTTVVKTGPPVVAAIRDLARLQSAEFYMERVIDLRDKQKHLWGLLETEDTILLVASARVTAGVDLSQLGERDVTTNWAAKKATIVLPPVQLFEAVLDNERTYVSRRDTDLLAKRRQGLETKARRQAEHHLIEAAREAGLLNIAEANAKRTVAGLVHSLGFTDVTITVRQH
ncbi:MAG TPA: DUF4230 domain-containing protein [Sorangium sp.]|nr:DUF4230 domain-containing protein [Sorangium sp.]